MISLSSTFAKRCASIHVNYAVVLLLREDLFGPMTVVMSGILCLT
jgi:hypothetical protein